MNYGDIRFITSAETHIFHSSRPDGTGFCGVYVRPNRAVFEARAFHRRVSPLCRTPSEAAKYLVLWWKSMYGADWPAIYRGFKIRGVKSRGWRIILDAEGGCRLSVQVVPTPGLKAFHPPGAWYLVPVQQHHERRSIVAKKDRSREADFLTKDDAKAAFAMWVDQTWVESAELSNFAIRAKALPTTMSLDDDDEFDNGTVPTRKQVPRTLSK